MRLDVTNVDRWGRVRSRYLYLHSCDYRCTVLDYSTHLVCALSNSYKSLPCVIFGQFLKLGDRFNRELSLMNANQLICHLHSCQRATCFGCDWFYPSSFDLALWRQYYTNTHATPPLPPPDTSDKESHIASVIRKDCWKSEAEDHLAHLLFMNQDKTEWRGWKWN